MGRELPIKPKQGMEICFDLNVYLFFTTEKKERKKEGGRGGGGGEWKQRTQINFFVQQVWTNIEGNRANLVQTAWALLSLIDAGQVGPSFSPKLFNKLYINMIDLGFSNRQSWQLVEEVS